ncbi:MAG: glycosyltransferase, partial [Planctomycetes bacterium]|nr:glycosyltransferase [Planctomycetota bacterium]
MQGKHKRILAEQKWGPIQRSCFIGSLCGATALAYLELELFVWIFSLGIIALYSIVVVAKVLAALCGVISRFTIRISAKDYAVIRDEELPIYTILLPMYKESAVVEKLLQNIGRLDYPKEKLDVKILLEIDDVETLAAVQAYGIPAWSEVLLIPDEGPKTKPRACNFGLAAAKGEYVVIYDAEDQPEADQLKKAVAAYKQQPKKVMCLQAKLNFFNAKEKILTRWFSLEYMCWFDLYLPGLHAIGAPIPLGGTSNHFKTEALRELEGWDPYNVTEDCDLGIRIAEAQYATRIIDSVTWEEAPIDLSTWLGQRSRWVKGYFQTFWVHTRQPVSSIRYLGLWGFLQML